MSDDPTGSAGSAIGDRLLAIGDASRLSRRDLRDLLALLAQEIGRAGLDTEPGRRAFELHTKLQSHLL